MKILKRSLSDLSVLLGPIVGIVVFALLPEVMLLIPTAVSASCAFMMPVATPPNAVVFGTGRLTIKEMARAGFWLNLIAIAVITLAGYFLIPLIFGS